MLVLAAVALSAGSAVAFTPTISEFSTGLNPDAGPVGIAAGPDGNLWFTDLACATAKAPGTCAIGEINPTTHAISEFSTGLNSGGIPAVIAPGPDGNLWFTDVGCDKGKANCAIGEINPTTHAIHEFSTGLNAGSEPFFIAAGPDGNLWFTASGCASSYEYGGTCVSACATSGTCAIGEINPATHAISEFSTGLNSGSVPFGIAAGPDGNMWFTDPACAQFLSSSGTCAIGEVNPATHAISEFSTGLNSGGTPFGIAAGPDGSLWFTDPACAKANSGVCAIGQIDPTTHAISEFSTGLNSGSLPAFIAPGPDGNLWFTDHGTTRAIGRITAPAATTHTLTVSVAGTGSGRVTGSGISCPGTCSHGYASGTSVALTASPASGSRFAGWGGACSGTGPCSVMMSSNRAVTAIFAKATVPATQISKAKISRKHHSATFTFKTVAATGFRCALLKPAHDKKKKPKARFSSCSSPKTYKHLKSGKYTFEVRAVAGLTPGPITKRKFTI